MLPCQGDSETCRPFMQRELQERTGWRTAMKDLLHCTQSPGLNIVYI